MKKLLIVLLGVLSIAFFTQSYAFTCNDLVGAWGGTWQDSKGNTWDLGFIFYSDGNGGVSSGDFHYIKGGLNDHDLFSQPVCQANPDGSVTLTDTAQGDNLTINLASNDKLHITANGTIANLMFIQFANVVLQKGVQK